MQKNIEGISISARAVGNSLGEYLTRGLDALASAFPALINQAAKFQDIADKTGGSAQGFAAFAVSAKVAGVGIEDIASASTKLSKNLLGVDDDSKAAGAALAALNIPIADFKKLKPDEQIKAVANAFGQFAEGGEKAAVAQQLFGKSGADLLKFFKDYTDNGGDVTILTDKMIQQADDHADAQARLREEISLYASALATNFLEPTTVLIGVLKDAAKEFFNTGDAITAFGANQGVQTFAENTGRALAGAIDYVKLSVKEFQVLTDFVISSSKAVGQVGDLNFAGAAQTGADFRKKYGLDELGRRVGDAGKDAALSFTQQYDKQLAQLKNDRNRAALNAINYGTGGDNRPKLNPTLPSKAGGKGDDPTKKLLDNDLAAFKAQGEQAKELLAERNKILDLYNSQGLLSVKDYYAALQGNLDEATRTQAKSYDDQIDALKKFQAAASKQTDVADAQGKINKLEEDKAKLYRASGTAALESSIKQVQAQKAVSDAFNEVNAKILEFNGNLRAAAEIRFDASNEKLLKQAVAEGNDETVKRIGLLKQYTLAQADITKATDAFSLAQGDLQIQEDRITLAQQRGTMGEIAGLKASGEARAALIPGLQAQLDALLAINQASLSPVQAQSIQRLKLQLDQLKASVDPLADKFNTMFGDAAGSAFGDFITGAKSASDAFKDFATSVTNQISQLVAKDLANTLFKSVFGGAPGSNGNGVGGMLSSLFGGSSGSGSFLGKLFGGGGGGSAALAGANAVGGAGGDALGAFIGLSKFSSGGFTGMGAANDPAGIVHRSEYVLDANTTRRLGVANLDRVSSGGSLGGGMVVNFAVQGKLDRSTQSQAANKLRRETITAGARFAG